LFTSLFTSLPGSPGANGAVFRSENGPVPHRTVHKFPGFLGRICECLFGSQLGLSPPQRQIPYDHQRILWTDSAPRWQSSSYNDMIVRRRKAERSTTHSETCSHFGQIEGCLLWNVPKSNSGRDLSHQKQPSPSIRTTECFRRTRMDGASSV